MQKGKTKWAIRLSPLVLLIPLLIGIVAVQAKPSAAHSAAQHPSGRIKQGANVHVSRQGTVNVSHLPNVSTHLASGLSLPARSRMTAAERAAYLKQANHLNMPGIPTTTAKVGTGPSYQVAPVSRNFEGINFTQSGCGCEPPDQALATNSGFTLEGVNTAFSIYDFAGNLVSGPIQYATFFSSVLRGGDFLSDPHLYYDSSTGRWINVIDELTPSGLDVVQGYFDVAISFNGTPTGSWHIYQFDTNTAGTGSASGDWADFPLLGVDQAGLWLTGVLFDNSSTQAFDGNTIFMLPKNTFYNGTAGTILNWHQIMNGLGQLAFTITPAQEIGTPQAEFMVTNDAGYGGPNTDFTLLAFTNTTAVNGGGSPVLTTVTGTLPVAYADPPGAQQPGTTNLIDTGAARPTQVQYQGGHLLMAWTTGVNINGDTATRAGGYWLDITPQLSTLAAHNPQWVTGWITNQASIYASSGAYIYYPVLEASSELDEALVFGYSSPGTGAAAATFPSLAYTSRRATDAPNTLGQNGTFFFVIKGTAFYSGSRWGDYSAGSLSTFQPYQQDGDRGYIWFAGEYSGTTSVWQTRVFSLRTQ